MSKIYQSIDELIGGTPLLEASEAFLPQGFSGQLLMKLEYLNPAGSVKDRIGKAMIDAAEEEGLLKPGGTIIEATSGNTGIALASVGAARGYKVVLVMPETMTVERRNFLKAYGAEIVLTSGDAGIPGANEHAAQLAEETENSFMPSQFTNPVNVDIHYKTTGPEIWEDTSGGVDIFVSGIGTGGTITGAGHYLKEKNPEVEMVAVEPAGSPLLSEGETGKHKIQGIGAGLVPDILDEEVYNEIVTVSDADALETAQSIAQEAGLFVGVSSGAALWAAKELAGRSENSGKTIVALLPDSGDRYLSMEGFIK